MEVPNDEILKLPFLIASLPIIAALMAFQLIVSIIVGLTSIATNLLAVVFIAGSVIGFAVATSAAMVWQAAGLGVFFVLAPHMAAWLLDKLSNLMIAMLDFLMS